VRKVLALAGLTVAALLVGAPSASASSCLHGPSSLPVYGPIDYVEMCIDNPLEGVLR
jgi:hypothetical protein